MRELMLAAMFDNADLFRQALQADRAEAIKRLMDRKVEEWLNDGPEEVARCLACWAEQGLNLGSDDDLVAIAESLFEES